MTSKSAGKFGCFADFTHFGRKDQQICTSSSGFTEFLQKDMHFCLSLPKEKLLSPNGQSE
ncbi:hypothetical protein ACTHRH_06880 [Paenibacillus sp. SAFN-117]|uniref:hypothetical protein n=1 Tax=Paenibacillus sp. 32O-W TaxID=1695218 RepID=UPI001C92EE70|nr:hypothetical protein [Paenibacillus sp. 32O-W]